MPPTAAAVGLSTDGKPCTEDAPWNFADFGLDDGYATTKHQAELVEMLQKAERDRARQRLIAEADRYVGYQAKEGYRVPFKAPATADGKPAYPWGSNAFIIANSMVIALAYDFTKEPEYRDAVAQADRL